MNRSLSYLTVMATLLAFAGVVAPACEGDHEHEHADEGHSHGEPAHDDHGDDQGGDHGDDHGHDHGSSRPAEVVTMAGEHSELFVEYPLLVAGQDSEFAAHYTKLDAYKPVEEGELTVVLTSDDKPGERWEASEPSRTGIFTPTVTPKYPGERRLMLILKTDGFTERLDLGTVTVFESEEDANEAAPDEPYGDISFLKEQQWKVDFGVVEAARRSVRPSVPVNATIRAASDGESMVTSPFDGRISAPSGGLPRIGQRVEAGDVVAYVVPSLSAGEISQLRSEVRKAKAELARAEQDLERVEGLVESGALPGKRLNDAQTQQELARADIQQAQRRLRQYRDLQTRGGAGSARVAIRAPINGSVAQRMVTDGGFVAGGDQLLRIVDRSQLWLEANVPEADLPRIGQPTGAWFEPATGDAIEIDVNDSGELVSFGEVVDPRTRTVPLTFALDPSEPRPDLLLGSFVRAHVYSGEPREVVAIPQSAVLDEKGMDVVFVMTSGESFERRTVQLGARDRQLVEVLEGIEPGERVVSQGAYYVKLAGTSTGSVGHGHSH
ncbi:MAG: efflux RND transporter periplasmic adaptor subunit [Myxococcota bacterium]